MDDFEFRDRPRAKEARRTTPWSPRMLELVRRCVLREKDDDFVLAVNVAHELNAPPHLVGACLKALVGEGLVLSRRPIAPLDREGEPVRVRLHSLRWETVGWNGRAWVVEKKTWKTSRKTGRVRHGSVQVEEVPVPGWDGYGYYILRGDEFRAACRAAGLPEDPVNDPWACKNEWCRTYNEGPNHREHCKKCHGVRHPRSEAGKKDDRPKVTCPRCGSVIPYKSRYGKRRADHPVRRCNLEVVRRVLEE